MAENTTELTVKVNTGNAEQQLSSLETLLNSVGQSAENAQEDIARLDEELQKVEPDTEAYQKIIDKQKELGKQFEDTGTSTVKVKTRIRELKEELSRTEFGTEKYRELSAELGGLNDQLKDVAEGAGQFAGPPLENLGKISGGVGDRLKTLDFDALSNDIKNFGTNIKNVNFKSIIDGIKGLGGAFKALGQALLANPILLAIAAIALAITAAVKAFQFFQEKAQESVNNANKKIDASNEEQRRKDKIRLAAATNDVVAQSKIKEEAAQRELKGTGDKIKNLEALQRRYYGLSEEQEKQLADLKKQKADQEVAIQEAKLLAIANLQNKNAEYDKIITQGNLTARQKANDELERWYKKELEYLQVNGATEADYIKLNTALQTQQNTLQNQFAAEDKAKSDARASEAKAKADARKAEEKALTDAIKAESEAQYQATLDTYDAEIRQSELKFEALRKQAGSNSKAIAEINQLEIDEQKRITKTYQDELVAAEKERIKVLQETNKQILAERQSILDSVYQAELENEKALLLASAKTAEERKEIERELAIQSVNEEYEARLAASRDAEKQLLALAGTNETEKERIRKEAYDRELLIIEAGEQAVNALVKQYRDEDTASLNEKLAAEEALRKQSIEKSVELAATAFATLQEAGQMKYEKSMTEIAKLDEQISKTTNARQKKELQQRRATFEKEARAQFEKNKKFQIAQALITTYQNATAAASSQYITGDPTSAVRAAIAAAVAITSGLLQVQKIRNTQFESGGDTGGGGSGSGGLGLGGNVGTPMASTSGAPNVGVNTQNLQNRPDQVVRAYVVGAEVTSSQEAQEKIDNAVRIG
jgi:hypothetical protein